MVVKPPVTEYAITPGDVGQTAFGELGARFETLVIAFIRDPRLSLYAMRVDGPPVPTVELVLNSKARPAVWKRVDLDSTHFDENALGWPWIKPPYSQADAPAAEQKFIYDTSYWSQSSAGHTFGDHLTDAERRSVIEYLKTL